MSVENGMHRPDNLTEPTVGYFGKLPSEADFVRYAASSPSAQAFQRWLQLGVETLFRANRESIGLQFLFSPENATTILVGALAPSRDRVGRSFPLALFGEFERKNRDDFSLTPVSWEPFLNSIKSTMGQLGEIDGGKALIERARERLSSREPEAPSVPIGFDETLSQWFDRSFVGKPPGQQFYALHVLLLACDLRRWRREQGQSLSLLFPLVHKIDLARWLSLVNVVFRNVCTVAAAFWTDQWLTVSLIEPSVQALVSLVQPDASVNRVWPSWTDKTTAISQAAAALPHALKSVLDDHEAKFDALLRSVSALPRHGGESK